MCTTPGHCDVVEEAVQQIEARHHQIHVLQTRLHAQMLELNGRWSGKAALAFQRKYSQFDTEFEKVKQCLDEIHVALVETQHADDRTTGVIDIHATRDAHQRVVETPRARSAHRSGAST